MVPRLIGCLAITAFAACKTTPGTQPQEMGATGHEQAAAAEQEEAKRHAALYERAARATVEQCEPERGGGCWTSSVNPTEQHLKEAERHLAAAEKHRAAGRALVQAEASACAGLTELDKDMSPFAHREDIESVAPLYTEKLGEVLLGARIAFRPVRGLTQARFERILSCHLARNAALGHDVPEMDYCPLVPKDVTAQVKPSGDRYLVDVQSGDPVSAQEIWMRAQRIGVPQAPSVLK